MALPKDPRQKMINIMYLVLTALLALNVSAEILNAFKVVDNSLRESNHVLTGSNNEIYKSFDDLLADPKTTEKAAKWKPKADQIKSIAADAYSFIEKQKQELKVESDLDPETVYATSDNKAGLESSAMPTTRSYGLNLNIKF